MTPNDIRRECIIAWHLAASWWMLCNYDAGSDFSDATKEQRAEWRECFAAWFPAEVRREEQK